MDADDIKAGGQQQSIETRNLSQRLRAKDQRRARLIKVARELISENDGGNFSMQELALRAELSLATPYNLFGSKLVILQEVFRAESEGFHKKSIELRAGAPVESVMATVENMVSVFARKPHFYRGLTRSLMMLSADDFRGSILPISEAMFRPLVDGLIQDGAIAIHIPAAVISTHLLRVFNSTFLLWASQAWDENTFRRELKTGFVLSFLGLFAGESRELLLAALRNDPPSL